MSKSDENQDVVAACEEVEIPDEEVAELVNGVLLRQDAESKLTAFVERHRSLPTRAAAERAAEKIRAIHRAILQSDDPQSAT